MPHPQYVKVNGKVRRLPSRNPIQIQQDYVDEVTAAYERWKHRPGIKHIADGVGGHYPRIVRGAAARAIRLLQAWGYNYGMAQMLVNDAHDIAILERASTWQEVDLHRE